MKIKYNCQTNELTVHLGDSLEFETDVHEFEDETVLTITTQDNKNSLIEQLKRGYTPDEQEDNVKSLSDFLRSRSSEED
tara:strand:+ start:580 stop:816 length:237 start_codon:yes stop_codon:yes gene_type:complete